MWILWSRSAASCSVVVFWAWCAAATCAAEPSDKPQWPKGLDCRKPEWRKELLARGGGTEESEKAVAAALKWLAEHQLHDGSWNFDLAACPSCKGKCRDSGAKDKARLAATGLALLPLLGAGHTHKTGDYQKTVQAGLYYLMNNMKLSPQGGSMHESEGSMYSHGIGTLALCEAYAMTDDKNLKHPAQATINFTCYAQDPVGGGWRYQPRQPGDTSVFGFQLTSLKAGERAGLRVPDATLKKAGDYLDSVQSSTTGLCGYIGVGQPTPSMSAVALLGRLHLGKDLADPVVSRGLKFLAKEGPSSNNFYYDYYATPLIFALGGESWKKWNTELREHLVKEQETMGHAAGSWTDDKRYGNAGGRLYATALATLILEVYYRYPPAGWKEQ